MHAIPVARRIFIAAAAILLFLNPARANSACLPCAEFTPAVTWGFTSIGALSEASGLAASRRNPGVLWTHNDGSRKRMYAIATNGATLSTFTFEIDVQDTEDMAVGPGPQSGVPYLYLGDIGGNAHPDDIRDSVMILRMPEPPVQLSWAGSPRSSSFSGIQTFTLRYPSGSFDAETLLVDPSNADLYVITKENDGAGVYRANLNEAASGSVLDLEFVTNVPFVKAAGGDISADGRHIVLRREDAAALWGRCENETIAGAFARQGVGVPVVGPPAEDNGEAIAFLPNGIGYVTISEGEDQPIHYFHPACLVPPALQIIPAGHQVRIEFHAVAGRVYSLEDRKTLGNGSWSYSGHTVQPAVDGTAFFKVDMTPDRTFYRVVVR